MSFGRAFATSVVKGSQFQSEIDKHKSQKKTQIEQLKGVNSDNWVIS
jgi:hypothetical protein